MKSFQRTLIGKPGQWLIEAAAEIGLDFSELVHEVTSEFVTHVMKHHGDAETEKARGQLPIIAADIMLIPDIIKNPNCAIIGISKYGKIFNVYLSENSNGTVIYYEEVLNSKKNKSLRGKTMYKKMGKMSNETFVKIVSNNSNTDMSGAKIMVGAGGHPDGEAE